MEAVLRPPVGAPAALRWVPGKDQLLVANQDGELFLCDPSGTHRLGPGLAEPRALDVHRDGRVLTISRTRWRIASPYAELEGTHDLRAHTFGLLTLDGAILVGNDLQDRRRVWLVSPRGAIGLPLPPRATVVRGPAVCESTPRGLVVTPIGSEPAPERTSHRLFTMGDVVMGLTTEGLTLWEPSGTPWSVKQAGVTAADTFSWGRLVAFGTDRGVVGVVRPRSPSQRPDRVRAHRDPVRDVALSTDGRWLATAAEQLRVWDLSR